MKFSRELSIPLFAVAMGLSIACAPALWGQLSNSNQFSLSMVLTNDVAVFTIGGAATNGFDSVDLFFKTNFTDSESWTWLVRCPASQTNLVMSNLPPAQGFFMLGVTNAIRPGFDAASLPREDDAPSTNAPLPFAMNFFNAVYSNIWVNNNGNVTFDNPQWAYTPAPLATLGIRIIAPYWADVDTDNPDSDVVKFGANTVDGHAAFGVDWVNVGYYQAHADKLLSCQLVIIDRSDIAPGDFDMEFNYIKVQWEWGDVSVGKPARVGFSDGVNDYELANSGVEGTFLDTNAVTGLIYNNLNSPVPGRYIFCFRDGQPSQPPP
jgi:hypothetical protein